MARTFRILGQQVTVGKRLYGIGKEDEAFGVAQLYGSSSKSIRQLDTYRGVVYACINLIGESVGDYQPIIEKPAKGNAWEDIGKHPFLDLLQNPGGTDDKAMPISMSTLFFMTAAFIELQGDVYWYMAKGLRSGEPREIVVLRSDKVGKYINKDTGDVEAFYVIDAHGGRTRIEIDEMLPFTGFDPKNPYGSIGTVQASMEFIETDTFSTIFTKNFFKNNAGISGVLSVGGEVMKTAFKKFVRAWRDKYQGVDNAGKVMIVRGSDAAKFEKVGLGLDELDMTALRKMSREDIAMMFRVPLPLLGKIEEGVGLGRGNIETLEYIFAKYNIDKKLKKYDQLMLFALQRWYGAKPGSMRVTHANIIPEDKEFLLNEEDKAVDRWLTRNEIRAKKGLDPVKGGDKLYLPFSNIPIEDASVENKASESSGDSSKGSGFVMRIKRPTSAKKKDSSQDITSVQKENFRVQLMRNQLLHERRYDKQLKNILVSQRKEALNNLEALASSLKASGPKLFDDSAADSLFEKVLLPTLINLGEDQGALALIFAGDTEHEFRMTAAYLDIIRRSTRKMATRFNDETLERLNATLAEGIQEGEALTKLKDRVESVYKYSSNVRSMRVARTETLKASNNATEDAYQQTGYVVSKAWVVNPDACPQCEAFDGKTIDLGQVFVRQGESYSYTDAAGEEQTINNTYDDVDNPPLHPNCRCTIIPVRG